MYIAIKGKSESFKFLRSASDVILSSASLVNDTNTSIVTSSSVSVSNDTLSETITSSAEAGTYSIQVTNPSNFSIGNKYYLKGVNGQHQIVLVTAIDSTYIELKSPLAFDISSSSTIEGIECTVTFTVNSDNTDKAGFMELVFNDASTYNIEVVLVKQKIYNPISSEDLYTRWSRLRGNAPSDQGGDEFQPQINEALDILRGIFWSSGYRLDHLKNSSLIKEPLLAQTVMILTKMGYDPAGVGDLESFTTDMNKQVTKKIRELLSSENIWIDTDGDNERADSEQRTIFRLRWD